METNKFDFFTLFIVICIALSMCGKTNTYTIEEELQGIKQEIHVLNNNLMLKEKETQEKLDEI